jgi:hypothetical protein
MVTLNNHSNNQHNPGAVIRLVVTALISDSSMYEVPDFAPGCSPQSIPAYCKSVNQISVTKCKKTNVAVSAHDGRSRVALSQTLGTVLSIDIVLRSAVIDDYSSWSDIFERA